jgi:hypothetical protein
MYNKLMNEFGEPELLDDILDHWSSSRHREEKARFLSALRTVSKETGCRVTLMSGDVHQCTYCFTSSTADNTNLVMDPGFMPQVRAVHSSPSMSLVFQHSLLHIRSNKHCTPTCSTGCRTACLLYDQVLLLCFGFALAVSWQC